MLMKLGFYLFLILVFVSFSAHAKTMKQHENDLISIFNTDLKYVNNNDDRPHSYEEGYGTFWRFRKALKKVLLMKESVHYPFDSLSQLINIHQSLDKRFRSLTWYEGGGTGSSFDQVFQYVDESNKIRVYETGDEDGDFNNNYLRLEQLEINKKPVYLVFGWSSGGGGTYCRCVKAFEIIGRRLAGANIFNDSGSLGNEIYTCQPRMYKNEIIFDPIKNEFSYDLYVTDDETGFPLKTKSKVYWKLITNEFIKSME